MKIYQLPQLLLLLAFVPNLAHTEVPCTDKPECWPEGSAMHTGLLLVKKQKAELLQLSKKHNELVKLVSLVETDTRLLTALKTQQKAWLKYRDEECELVGSLTGAGGSWPSTYATECETNNTSQRLHVVQVAIACIKDIPAEERIVEQNRCLEPLAPLTNR